MFETHIGIFIRVWGVLVLAEKGMKTIRSFFLAKTQAERVQRIGTAIHSPASCGAYPGVNG